MKINNRFLKAYVFIDNFNSLIEKKIKKIKNIGIIYENTNIPNENFFKILKFCKRNKIKLYILDNFKTAIKYKISGFVISSANKSISRLQSFQLKKRNIEILGKAHNQLEFYQKKIQGCDVIFLSPIFFTFKYSANKALGISRFNLISLKWNLKLIALGGINLLNYKKIMMTKAVGVGVKTLINYLDKKKPAYI
jgi:thiamine-phosphate pyrophosphorylase